MLLRMLGPLELTSGPVQAGRVATLLALLAIDGGRPVSLNRLMDQLWGDEPPSSGVAALHVYVSRLRRQLEGSGLSIVTQVPGYALTAPDSQLDVRVFRDLVRSAATAIAEGRAGDALHDARRALELWRGEPFLDTAPAEDLLAAREQLSRLRHDAQHVTARALLALGRPLEAEPLSRELTEIDPLNEGFWRLRMQCQVAAGNGALALATFEEYRQLLAELLGADPGERIRALQLEVLRGGDSPAEPERRAAPVQRPVERASLERAVRGAAEGTGSLVVVEGEPGIGKTALAEHGAAAAVAAGMRVVRARAIAGAGTPPWWIWEQVLGRLDGRPGAEVVRTLAHAASVTETDPDRARFRLAELIAGTVVDAARERPTLIVFDDLQWADVGSLEVLDLVQVQIRDVPCVLVVTARTGADRPPGVGELLTRLGRGERCVVHHLSPFTLEEVAQVARNAGVDRSPAELLDVTGGNPYFLTELLASDPDHPPETVLELLRGRFVALPEASRSLLELAAVAGREIDVALLGVALELEPIEVLDGLEAARAVELVLATSSGWQFRHDLARQAVAENIAPADRVRAHGRIARAIGIVHGDDLEAHLDVLAHHVSEAAAGGRSLEDFEVCSAAADLAADRLAFNQAAAQRERALALLPPGDGTRELRFESLMRLTVERRLSGDPIAASVSLRQATELARRSGDDERLSRAVSVLGGVTLWNWRQFEQVDAPTIAVLDDLLASPMEPRRRAELLGTLAVELYYDDDRRRGEALAAEAVRLGRELGDPALLGRALNNQVIAMWAPGNDSTRLEALDEALGLVGSGLPLATEAIARMHRGPLLLAEADVAGFEADLDRASRLASRVQLPEIRAQSTTQRAAIAMMRGDRAEARRLIDESHAVMSGTSLWGAEWVRFVQLATLGRLEGQLEQLVGPVVDKASEDAYRPLRWTALLLLAETGQHREALAMQARWGLRSLGSRLHWVSGFECAQAAEVALALGSPDLTEVYAALLPEERRVVLAGTAVAVWGPVARLLARLARAVGREDRAREHDAIAHEVTDRVATGLGMVPDWPLR